MAHPWPQKLAPMPQVTDQIDALDTLSARPLQYLVAPRLLAGTICLPFLVLIGDIIGVFGGYLVGVYGLDFNPGVYLSKERFRIS